MIRARSLSNRIADTVIALFLIISSFLCLVPILNTLAVSLSDKLAADSGLVFFWPVKLTTASYTVILADENFLSSFWMTIKRVVIGVSINTILTILLSFPLSRETKDFPARNIFMWFVVFTMLFSGGLIPWYYVVSSLGLRNSIWALVLPGAVPVFNAILLMNFFRGVPKELDEAAYIDGAGAWQLLFKIYLPVSVPALATIILFQVVGHWNSFFDGLLFMNRPENYPLQTYIQQLVIAFKDITKITDPQELKRLSEISSRTMNAAKIFVSMIPILVIYPFLQKYFIHGIVLGSVKE